MSAISNFIMKKNIPIGMKSKKKSIPININSNPAPGKFLISNQINPVASAYLSMGQKIQNFKTNFPKKNLRIFSACLSSNDIIPNSDNLRIKSSKSKYNYTTNFSSSNNLKSAGLMVFLL